MTKNDGEKFADVLADAVRTAMQDAFLALTFNGNYDADTCKLSVMLLAQEGELELFSKPLSTLIDDLSTTECLGEGGPLYANACEDDDYIVIATELDRCAAAFTYAAQRARKCAEHRREKVLNRHQDPAENPAVAHKTKNAAVFL